MTENNPASQDPHFKKQFPLGQSGVMNRKFIQAAGNFFEVLSEVHCETRFPKAVEGCSTRR